MHNRKNAMKITRDTDDGPTGQSSRNMGEPKPSPFCLWQRCYYHTRNKLQWRILMLSRIFMWKISVFSCNTLFVISIGLYAIVEKKVFWSFLGCGWHQVHLRRLFKLWKKKTWVKKSNVESVYHVYHVSSLSILLVFFLEVNFLVRVDEIKE